MAHYVFSIVYTYVYYPPIWKNVIEGFMEVIFYSIPQQNYFLNLNIEGFWFTATESSETPNPELIEDKMKKRC